MTELPKKLKERIGTKINEFIERWIDINGEPPSYGDVVLSIAQELYADLALAVDALKKAITQDRTKGYPTGAEWDFIIDQHKAAITALREKYNDQETEGGRW